MLLIREALLGAERYNEFYHRLDITHATLSGRLKRLVEIGLLTKDGNAEGPDIYHLTDMGRDLYVVLIMVREWQIRYPDIPGNDWRRNRDFVHTVCGHRFDPLLACAKCSESVTADNTSAREIVTEDVEPPESVPVRRQVKVQKRDSGRTVNVTVGVESDRWAMMIMAACFFGVARFSDFRERLSITPQVLSNRLAMLVDRGMLRKRVYNKSPKRFEYLLTEKGKEVYPIIVALMQFGDRWLSPKGAPILLKHEACGKRLKAILQCSHCGKPVKQTDIALIDREQRSTHK